jgi:TonB family protein
MQMPTPPAEFWGTREDQVVMLELLIREDGSASVQDVVSSPGKNYTSAALRAVKEWTFEAGTCDGKPVTLPFTVSVTFEHDREHM